MNERRRAWGFMPLLIASFAVIHTLILILDWQRPEAFLRADRAHERWEAIQALQNMNGWTQISSYIGTHGILGDYVIHTILYSAAGQIGIIVFQVALLLLSAVAVFHLARLLNLSPTLSSIAAALYLLMPHSLVFPHQLVSEALYVPLVVISTWALCAAIRRTRLRLLIFSGLLLGVCTLIRPITLLWPLLAMSLIGALHSWRRGTLFAATAYVPIVLWMLVVHAYTGVYGLGESGHTMGRNLYLRIGAIAQSLPQQQRQQIENEYLTDNEAKNISPTEYLNFATRYPAPFLRHILRDSLVFFGKSGIERITVDYFTNERQFKSLTASDAGWRTRFDREGLAATVRHLWDTLGIIFVLSLVGSALMVILMLLAIAGAFRLLKAVANRSLDLPARVTAAVLIAFPIYIFVFSTVANAVQSRQRAPAEFALIILAAALSRRLG